MSTADCSTVSLSSHASDMRQFHNICHSTLENTYDICTWIIYYNIRVRGCQYIQHLFHLDNLHKKHASKSNKTIFSIINFYIKFTSKRFCHPVKLDPTALHKKHASKSNKTIFSIINFYIKFTSKRFCHPVKLDPTALKRPSKVPNSMTSFHVIRKEQKQN